MKESSAINDTTKQWILFLYLVGTDFCRSQCYCKHLLISVLHENLAY